MFSTPVPTRRDFLKAAVAGGAALALPRNATASAIPAKAKSCIVILLTGGPSQLDTWDPKPNAPSTVRGPFATIPTTVPGMHLSELFPKMASIAEKFSLIRTMHHEHAPIHENGLQLLNTGRRFGDGEPWPSVGSVVSYVKARQGRMCFHSVIPSLQVDTGLRLDAGLSAAHLPADVPITVAENSKWYQREAYPRCPFGETVFGNDCSWAAVPVRLCESFSVVNAYPSVFDVVSWDCHADEGSLRTTLADYRDEVAPTFDTAFTALIQRLEQKGVLDSTLVVAVGEFGRTPKLNANGGRDHWSNCWTAIVAGGGVQGGRIIGESDATASEPKNRPVHCSELVATIYEALGIPTTTMIPGPTGSPAHVVEAEPIRELF